MIALVTGGGGFLGGAIVRRLVARGDTVRSFSRGEHPGTGAVHHRGDIADAGAVSTAAAGCDIVFHVAAKAGVGMNRKEYVRANVTGTENVLAACRAHGIRKLVFTSSPSVTFDGRDQDGVDETTPYPAHFLCPYAETKAAAERLVLAANTPDFATVALRPHLIWGPGDPHLVPRIVSRARAGKLRFVGPSKKIDSVYIDNAADAHVLAADRLAPGAACAGRAYFISNGEPMPVDELINGILAAAHLPPVTARIGARMAYFVGWILERIYPGDDPPLTRFVARQLATSHWFDLSAAKRDLGYAPGVSIAEGLRRLEAALTSPGSQSRSSGR